MQKPFYCLENCAYLHINAVLNDSRMSRLVVRECTIAHIEDRSFQFAKMQIPHYNLCKNIAGTIAYTLLKTNLYENAHCIY